MHDFEKLLPKPSCSYPTWGMLHKVWQEGAEAQRNIALAKIGELSEVFQEDKDNMKIILGWAETAKRARLFQGVEAKERQCFSPEEERLLTKIRAFLEQDGGCEVKEDENSKVSSDSDMDHDLEDFRDRE